MHSEPKPCPFCGCAAEGPLPTEFSDLFVRCTECKARGPEVFIGGNLLGAANRAELRWNSRHHDSPHTETFFEAVRLEAMHQRERWGSEHDAGKGPTDWFWLLGFLGGKAVWAATHGDREKALHHTISTAGVLLNWHAHLQGENTIRPGIETPKGEQP